MTPHDVEAAQVAPHEVETARSERAGSRLRPSDQSTGRVNGLSPAAASRYQAVAPVCRLAE